MTTCNFKQYEIDSAIGRDEKIAKEYQDRADAVRDHLLEQGMTVSFDMWNPCETGRLMTLSGSDTTAGEYSAQVMRSWYLGDNPMVTSPEKDYFGMARQRNILSDDLKESKADLDSTSAEYQSRIDELESTIDNLDGELATRDQSILTCSSVGLGVLALTLGIKTLSWLRNR
tara:strand:- start:1173 stop:1688 length:516 start_codon:yes stop_codon:yes gene_type:complete